jgi:hypothetical protein
MKFRLPAVSALILAGCAIQQAPAGLSVSRDQSTTKNRDRDLYECEREATFADGGTKSQVFDNCMKARGYKQK